MPAFKFEAMDTTGSEVKDSIDAINEEEAQQKIKQMGYFVTKLTVVSTAKGKGGKGKAKVRQAEEIADVFTIGSLQQAADDLHPPILDAPGRRPAGVAVAQDSGKADAARRAEELADRRGRRR